MPRATQDQAVTWAAIAMAESGRTTNMPFVFINQTIIRRRCHLVRIAGVFGRLTFRHRSLTAITSRFP